MRFYTVCCALLGFVIVCNLFVQAKAEEPRPFSYMGGEPPFVMFYINVSGNNYVNTMATFSELLTTQPDIVADALKAYFPNNYKIVHVINANKPNSAKDPPYGSTPKQGEYIVVFKEGEFPGGTDRTRQLQVYLSINPDPNFLRVNSSQEQIKEFEKARLNFTRRVQENIAKTLPDFSKQYAAKELAKYREGLEKKLDVAEHESADAQKRMSAASGMPSEKFSEQLAEISRQQIAAKLSLVGMDARQKAITEEIAKTQNKMRQTTDSEETLKNLEKLLQLRTQRLDDLKKMHDSGLAPTADVQTAEADLLSAKIELDKTNTAIKRASGGEQLDAFNNELSRLAIDRAEAEARLDFLSNVSNQTERQLHDRRDAEKLAEEAQPQLDKAKKTIAELSAQLDQVKNEQENIEPLCVILPDDSADNSQPASSTSAAPSSENSQSEKRGN